MISSRKIQRPETVLFVGAGATASLNMPTTQQQAMILWEFCENDVLTVSDVAKAAKILPKSAEIVVDILAAVDSGLDGTLLVELDSSTRARAFPGVSDADLRTLLPRLRCHYDWGALKLVAATKKGDDPNSKLTDSYLQEVFTLFDTCIRDNRGFEVYRGDKEIFLSVARLTAARETLVLLINTLFSCAWREMLDSVDDRERLKTYRAFFHSLAKMMQKEGRRLIDFGCRTNYPEFYQLSYSVITTNFEPMFLWLIWNAHDKVNHECDFRIGSPGRMLKLLLNFPNTLGMRKPNDECGGERLSSDIWFPCTDAVAQSANKNQYDDNRVFRIGKYFAVHGMSNTRQCPVCGRLNLYMGDTWSENSKSLFPNTIVHTGSYMQEPRTKREVEARNQGAYDALECHFCGAMTYAYDNFMYMQTQLKLRPPSFIKETTDEALSFIAGAKHIVLLGYSLPLDDAVWGSLLTTMSRRPKREKLYCSVVGHKDGAPDHWMIGDELRAYVRDNSEKHIDYESIRCIRNAVTVFGWSNVRAYMRGVPDVFKKCSEKDVLELMYPSDVPGWCIKEFSTDGVVRASLDVRGRVP